MIFQIGTALLDACVLAVLKNGDAYGYVLTQKIGDVIEISESTLYPVLRRLQKDDFLDVYDQPFGGRNRRYYRITGSGKEKLAEYSAGWSEYKQRVDKILTGGIENDQA